MFVLTVLLVVPIATMAPDEDASDNPGGPVYDLEDLIDTQLPRRVHSPGFVVEARDGDILAQAPLRELYRNTERLRQADAEGRLHPPELPQQPYLYNGFDADRQQPVVGIFTIADAVQEVLQRHPLLGTDLEHANDDQVKLAVHQVLNDPRTDWMKEVLSQKKTVERRPVLGQEIDYWTSPAFVLSVFADNEKLGGSGVSIGATSDPVTEGKEHFNRKVQSTLRGDQNAYRLWGIAIDAGLEISDEVSTAVPFIAATFIVVLVVVGFALRSVSLVFLTALGLIAMIIWLKGLSNLVGLNSSTTLDFIVPIAMISLGADFVIHAASLYRQQRRIGLEPRSAFRTGTAAVLVALTLAAATDSIAFISNASAEIETVIGFGIGATLAVLAAFIILGLTVPLAFMRFEAWSGKAATSGTNPGADSTGRDFQQDSSRLARVVVALAQRRYAVLPVAALVTAVAGFYAFQLEASFNVKDFFNKNSDFVVGLDTIDDHLGKKGGEPATIYIQGDLTDPDTLAAIKDFQQRLGDNPYVAKNDYGEASLQTRSIFVILDQVISSGYARAQIEQASGVSISTDGGLSEFEYAGKVHRWPNSREELAAIFGYVAVNGVPLSPTRNIYDPLEVGQTFFHDPSGVEEDATTLVLGIPGTREQTNVIKSRDSLTGAIKSLELAPSISFVGLTGSPYTRQAALDATTDGLQRALPIAVVLCLVVALVAMRSFLFGIVTIFPIGLVVAWLYAFMFGFRLWTELCHGYHSRRVDRSGNRLFDTLYSKVPGRAEERRG